jgi:hypothetical protein
MRILSESKIGVNRSNEILKVIRLCQIAAIIVYSVFNIDVGPLRVSRPFMLR